VLNNTPADQLRDKIEDVFAVDRWLWFLAVENLFVDDDSYWNKGADYAFTSSLRAGAFIRSNTTVTRSSLP
jgi:spore coat protein CotH